MQFQVGFGDEKAVARFAVPMVFCVVGDETILVSKVLFQCY